MVGLVSVLLSDRGGLVGAVYSLVSLGLTGFDSSIFKDKYSKSRSLQCGCKKSEASAASAAF